MSCLLCIGAGWKSYCFWLTQESITAITKTSWREICFLYWSKLGPSIFWSQHLTLLVALHFNILKPWWLPLGENWHFDKNNDFHIMIGRPLFFVCSLFLPQETQEFWSLTDMLIAPLKKKNTDMSFTPPPTSAIPLCTHPLSLMTM